MAIPSVSPDVEAENACAEKIAEALAGERESLRPMFWSAEDGRKNVACLLKSRHPQNTGKTVVLMSHFDTVGVDDFARFGDSNLAFQPDELVKVMQTTLEQKDSLTESEQSALEALRSGEWMFGRGSVDMKSGVAVNIALMREFARRQAGKENRLIDELAGNLLFLSCPDEETESVGILSAVPELLKLREKENLTYLGAINTDYTAPRDSNRDARFVYSGTVGKLLPSFYILGVRTHVGEIFRGVDASHIAAELVSRINLNPDWIDSWRDEETAEVAPPPIALQMRDLKPSYNVETAGEAFVYINWLTLTMTPDEAMLKMKETAHAALEAVRARREESFRHFESLGGQAQTPPVWTPSVLEYESLLALAKKQWEIKKRQTTFSDWLETKVGEFKLTAEDGRQLSRMIVAELANLAQINGPVVVVFYSPPYYPSVPPQENEGARAVDAALAGQADRRIQRRGFYPYISDLSYLTLESRAQIESLSKNMPLFNLKDSTGKLAYALDEKKLEEIRALNCPVINIGPFGSDAHGLYERVHMPYSFEVVPQVIFETIVNCFEMDNT